MIELWTPAGNIRQVAVDLEIEAHRHNILKYKKDLVNLRSDRTVEDYELKNYQNTIDTLALDCIVVSMAEFHSVKKLIESVKRKIAYTEAKICGILKKVDEAETLIADLQVRREKLETKILEFKQRG